MKITYAWNPEYVSPDYWNLRTPLYIGMPKFFLFYQNLNDKKLRVFLKALKGRILDAGCGRGRLTAYSDVGIDFSREMLKSTKTKHKHKMLVRASILCLPFKDETFSASFSIDVLLHISPENRKSALKELGRVSANPYIFLAEHRTIAVFFLELIRIQLPKFLGLFFPYISVLLAFPIDRLRKLKIESNSQILKKLTNCY
ncbi:MAG: class I SAM-dependent methyltransferase [Candidatus Bathyarchaeota archaeon]|nr:class I SAM-dependent methyltransferase [Candidatus Bathyarchaeota archaeon]